MSCCRQPSVVRPRCRLMLRRLAYAKASSACCNSASRRLTKTRKLMNMKTHIFREYDIRGIVDKDLTGNISELIGRAFGSEVKKRIGGTPTIAVGHDNRPH